jgi:hypothetical protein
MSICFDYFGFPGGKSNRGGGKAFNREDREGGAMVAKKVSQAISSRPSRLFFANFAVKGFCCRSSYGPIVLG